MAKDYKYKDSTPVDEPVSKGKAKAVEPGSGIRVAPEKKTNYGYSIQRDTDPTLADQSGDRFNPYNGELIVANQPDRKSMRYLGKGDETDFDVTRAGAGRGKQGGPTAKELGMKKGGMTASARADGIAQRGKTRGTIVMCGGGYAKAKK